MITIDELRKPRIFGYAIFDFVVSFIAVYLLAPLLSKLFLKIGIYIPKKNWLFLTLPFSILIHLLFGTMTKMTEDFLNPNGYYVLKIVMLFLLILGLMGIKFVKRS